MTNADTLLALISKHPEGLDDDEISEKTGIKPRQQVYYICTRLAAEGRVRRVSVQASGKRRKIHNFPTGATLPPSSVPQSNAAIAEGASWRRRLSMLVAATGREDLELLDEALLDLARKLLREDVLDKKPAKKTQSRRTDHRPQTEDHGSQTPHPEQQTPDPEQQTPDKN